jgi:hypothetical protein
MLPLASVNDEPESAGIVGPETDVEPSDGKPPVPRNGPAQVVED